MHFPNVLGLTDQLILMLFAVMPMVGGRVIDDGGPAARLGFGFRHTVAHRDPPAIPEHLDQSGGDADVRDFAWVWGTLYACPRTLTW